MTTKFNLIEKLRIFTTSKKSGEFWAKLLLARVYNFSTAPLFYNIVTTGPLSSDMTIIKTMTIINDYNQNSNIEKLNTLHLNSVF